MGRRLVLLLALAASGLVFGQDAMRQSDVQLTSRGPWLFLAQYRFVDASGIVSADVASVQTERAAVRLLHVPFELSQSSDMLGHSLQDVEVALRRQSSPIWAAFNGGFSSYQVDVPLGLLIIDGRVYSTLEQERKRSLDGVSEARFRWAGLLCQRTTDKHWGFMYASEYEPGACINALQAGPVLVERGGIVGIGEDEPQRRRFFARTAVCFSPGNLMRFVVTSQTSLRGLAEFMVRPEVDGGLGCTEALNLSGETSSGALLKLKRAPDVIRWGTGTFPIPSAIWAAPGRYRDDRGDRESRR